MAGHELTAQRSRTIDEFSKTPLEKRGAAGDDSGTAPASTALLAATWSALFVFAWLALGGGTLKRFSDSRSIRS